MQIAPGIHSIRQTGRQTYPSGYSHAYLLETGPEELTLIDTLGDTDGRLVLDMLRGLNRPVGGLRHILLTHCHRSHVSGAARLRELSGATVYAHPWEAEIISGKRSAPRVSLLPLRPLRIFPQRLGLALRAGHPPCPVDRHLGDGDAVGPVRVIHVPGHTPGALVYYWPEQRALFTGDNIVSWPSLRTGWPGFQLDAPQFRRSMRYMEESVARLAEDPDQPVAVIGVAHGEPVTRGATEHLRSLVDAAWSGRIEV